MRHPFLMAFMFVVGFALGTALLDAHENQPRPAPEPNVLLGPTPDPSIDGGGPLVPADRAKPIPSVENWG